MRCVFKHKTRSFKNIINVYNYLIVLEVKTTVKSSEEEPFGSENYNYSVNATEITGKFGVF